MNEFTMKVNTANPVDGADALIQEVGLVAALQYANAVATMVREQAEAEREQLTTALGQPAKAPTRTRAAPHRPAAPATQQEATERVRKALADAGEALSVRSLARRTSVPADQVKAILAGLGAVQHGLKYAIKAAT